MLKAIFIAIVIIHTLIHLLGFVKAFGLAEIDHLTKVISKPVGLFWLLATCIILASAIMYQLNSDSWAVIALAGVVLSQLLILTAWQDARFGTFSNVIIFLVAVVGLGEQRFKNEAEQLLSSAATLPNQEISIKKIAELPEPVQRYYNYAIKDKTLIINNIRLKHSGQFKPDPEKDWMNIQGEQYFSVADPGFIWRGKTAFSTAYDKYIEGNGSFIVKLLSLVQIVDAEGSYIDEAELQRWIGENIWFPVNFFFHNNFFWEPIDENKAELIYKSQNHKLSMLVTFSPSGQLMTMETRRFMSEDRQEVWRCLAREYKERGGMMIPTRIEAVWALDSGDYSYARFKVEEIEYNVSEVF